MIEHSDHVIVMAPLPKLLQLESHEFLNKIAPTGSTDPYDSYDIPERVTAHLLTTVRPENSLSLFRQSSRFLTQAHDAFESQTSYSLSSPLPTYNPIGSAAEVRDEEFPHDYVMAHFEAVYGYPADTR